MDKFEQESDEILTNKNTISGITSLLSENPEQIRKAMQLASNSRALQRYARGKQSDSEVVRNINGTSKRDRDEIARIARGAPKLEGPQIPSILVGSNGYAKKIIFPSSSKLEEWERKDLTDEIGYLIDKNGGRTNKCAQKVIGEKVFGEMIVFRKAPSEKDPLAVAELTPKEFESMFPKIMHWKCAM